MVILIHGEDTPNSRKKIDEFLKNFSEVIRINLNQDRPEKIINSLESQSLFDNKKAIIIEYISKLKKTELDDTLSFINKYKNSVNINIILWEDAKLNDTILKRIDSKQIFLYDLPKYYFQFLDSIFPGNGIKCISLYRETLKNISDVQLFYSVVKRIRTLIILKLGKPGEFEETKKMGSWQLGKLVKQEKAWDEKKLMDFYKKLFEIELNMKTSNLPMSLSEHIDILLLSL